jgi:hypothetical protein
MHLELCLYNNKHRALIQYFCCVFALHVSGLRTPCSTALLEKLTSLHLIKKFPTFYGAWSFIIAFTSGLQLSLSWGSSIQSITPHISLHEYPSTFQVTTLLSLFRCLDHAKVSVQVQGVACEYFIMIFFHGEELLAIRPTPKLEDNHLPAVCECFFNISVGILHIGGHSSICNL